MPWSALGKVCGARASCSKALDRSSSGKLAPVLRRRVRGQGALCDALALLFVLSPVKACVIIAGKGNGGGRVRTKQVALGGLLTALALMIPIWFCGYLQVRVPPFSATLFSHVPEMLAMLVSPAVAAFVALGSTFGFLVTLGSVVAARAFVHLFWGVAGAVLVRRGWSLVPALALALPIHALGEALAVLLFGYPPSVAFLQVGVGTALHHIADGVFSLAVARVLGRSLVLVPRAVRQR